VRKLRQPGGGAGALVTTAAALLVLALALALAASTRPRPPPPSAKAMVIVEPRAHPDLCAVLLNFHERVPPDWDLYVFHGASHARHARGCTHGLRGRRVALHALHTDNMTGAEYSALFVQADPIWGRVEAEHILVFQTDTAACGAFPGSADDFLGFAYAGCSVDERVGLHGYWGHDNAFYGSGGLSFRTKSSMLRCIRDGIPYAAADPQAEEDLFFSNCLEASPHRRPNATALARLCTMNLFMAKSFGAHQIGRWLHKSHRAAFLEYCPEARALQFAAGEGHLHVYADRQAARPHRFYQQAMAFDAEPTPIEPL
jgi:hypothetical protein